MKLAILFVINASYKGISVVFERTQTQHNIVFFLLSNCPQVLTIVYI